MSFLRRRRQPIEPEEEQAIEPEEQPAVAPEAEPASEEQLETPANAAEPPTTDVQERGRPPRRRSPRRGATEERGIGPG